VESLRRQGVSFDFQLVEGMSQIEARRCYERADLVVDQLLAGWYGGLAVEAMALGKPVLCYLRDEDLEWIPAGMRSELPLIGATPGSIEEVLRCWILKSREERLRKGEESRRFVERWHDPYRVASGLLEDYAEVLDHRSDRSPRGEGMAAG
jgi:glycosyltransferase involved in cell wall biosynthesis